jgi:hypothetical protein
MHGQAAWPLAADRTLLATIAAQPGCIRRHDDSPFL